MIRIFLHASLFLLGMPMLSHGQSFVNPSFEGEPREAFVPVGWHPCSPNTTPDIFPGVWGVEKEPQDGNTYMGLITRYDASFESVGQRLPLELSPGECYKFTIHLARAMTYAGFNDSIRCRVWLGDEKCRRRQLILETDRITKSYWQPHEIRFEAEKNYRYIIIEAAFPAGEDAAKGNILVDQLSAILPCDRT